MRVLKALEVRNSGLKSLQKVMDFVWAQQCTLLKQTMNTYLSR